jgi:rhamnogalacturonan endolyase
VNRISFLLTTLSASALLLVSQPALAEFGLDQHDPNFYKIDTGAGLVFQVRRTDNGSNSQSIGDISSMVYNGVQYQDQTRGSQITSGFDFLYKGVSAVSVAAAPVGADFVKVTVKAGNLTHYYMVKRGMNNIYMATHFSKEPDQHNLVRYIVRVPNALLPYAPVPSDIRNNIGPIEAKDVFKLSNGQTRSKHYSNMRVKDWAYFGATGPNVGMWFVRDNQEGGSGGPFYRSLLNQSTDVDQELAYIVNYGEAQTEKFRMNVLNAYTLVFTNGGKPATPDTSWLGQMGLAGYVGPAGRGGVAGVGIAGRVAGENYTVGFANAYAQYWVNASATNGSFLSAGMRPGTYTLTVYKNELEVHKRIVTVTAGKNAALNTITVNDPASAPALWRIGKWDGSPREFLNGDKVTSMHPSDPRMARWVVPDFVVGSSSAATAFPAYQWKNVNTPLRVKFYLSRAQVANRTVRIGVTVTHAGARPQISLNNKWTSDVPDKANFPPQPTSRTLTVGTYRGNNTTFPFAVPAAAFAAGWNVLTISPASGVTGDTYLNPGYSIDAVDLL